MKIPSFGGTNDPDAYFDWKTIVERIYKVQMVVTDSIVMHRLDLEELNLIVGDLVID